MRVIWAIGLAMMCCAGQAADAGAWLREKNSGFASLSFGATQGDTMNASLYVEYGVSEKTTIGVDINAFHSADSETNGFGALFLRRAIGPTDHTNKFAYEIGLGGFFEDENLPAFKTAVSWGRGLQLGERQGWVNVDAAYIYEPTLLTHQTKLDATAGLDLTPRMTGILEINFSDRDGNSNTAVEPSLLFKPSFTDFHFKLGANIPMDNADTALELGIWRNF